MSEHQAARSRRATISISSTDRAICSAPITRCRRLRANPTGCRPARSPAFATCCGSCSKTCKGGDKPTHLAVIFDAGKTTFRNAIYPQYKANRPEPPEDLIPQFPLVRDATRAFSVACVEEPGFEADDLIATYARLAREGRRAGHHRVLRQGSDAARRRRRGRVARHDEEQAPRLGRGDGEIRRAAVARSSRCRRWPAIPPTTCPACAASA